MKETGYMHRNKELEKNISRTPIPIELILLMGGKI